MIGNENSVFISANGSYGVVYIANNGNITCATCRFGCVHVQTLTKLISTVNLELPHALQQFYSLLTNKIVPGKQYPDLTCVSKCKIPFDLPINLSAVLRMSTAERYRMYNNVAQLVPQSLSIACTKCSQISWNDPYLEHNAIIVSTNEVLNAQG